MAVDEPVQHPDDLLRRAAAELRAEHDPGWNALGGTVIAAAKAAARRSRPIAAEWPDESGPGPGADRGPAAAATSGRLRVSDLVVRSQVRRAAGGVPGCRVLRVQVRLDGEVLVGLEMEVAVAYGADARLVGDAVRVGAALTLDEVLGPDRPGAATMRLDVAVTDVDAPRPR